MADASGSNSGSRSRKQPVGGSSSRKEELHTSWEEREMEEERDRIQDMLQDRFGRHDEERQDWNFEDETAAEQNQRSKKSQLASGDGMRASAAGGFSAEVTASVLGKPTDRDARNARSSRGGSGDSSHTQPRVSLEGLVDMDSDWEQLLEVPGPVLPVLHSRRQQPSSQSANNKAPSPHHVHTPPPSRESEAESSSPPLHRKLDIQDRLQALSARLGDLLPRVAGHADSVQSSRSPAARTGEHMDQVGSSSSKETSARYQGMPREGVSESRNPVAVGDLISLRISPIKNSGSAVSKSLSGLDEKLKQESGAMPASLSSSLQFSRQTDSVAGGKSSGRRQGEPAQHAWKLGKERGKEEEEEVNLMDEEVDLVNLDDSFTPVKGGISFGAGSPGNTSRTKNISRLPAVDEDPDWLLGDMGNAGTDENMNLSKSLNTSKERSSPLGEDAYDKIIEQFHQLQRNVAATLHESLTHLTDDDENEDTAQPRQNMSGSSQEDRMMADLSRKYLHGKTPAVPAEDAEEDDGDEDGAAYLLTPPKKCSGLPPQGSPGRGGEFEDDLFAESDSILLESSPQ